LEDYRKKAPAKCKAAYGYYCCHAAVHRLRSDCSWCRPSYIPRSCMARKCGYDKSSHDKMSQS
jgi:hypothetical protein